MFAHTTGIKMIHVPYRGSGPSLTDAIGGQIPIVTATLAAAMTHIKAGKPKALAVTSTERWTHLPDVTPVAEAIGKPFQDLNWAGVRTGDGQWGERVCQNGWIVVGAATLNNTG